MEVKMERLVARTEEDASAVMNDRMDGLGEQITEDEAQAEFLSRGCDLLDFAAAPGSPGCPKAAEFLFFSELRRISGSLARDARRYSPMQPVISVEEAVKPASEKRRQAHRHAQSPRCYNYLLEALAPVR